MNNRKILLFLSLLLFFTLLFTIEGRAQPSLPYEGGTTPKPGTHDPIITHSYAVDKGRHGYIWKIYIEAEDPNGDMYKIASVVDEPGYGRYPTDWIILKSEYRKHFKGYIQWNTNSGCYLPEWTEITLKVSVIDKAGNESNVAVFPFTFESGVKNQSQSKLPAPFDQGDLRRLGYIHINLVPPGGLGTESSDIP